MLEVKIDARQHSFKENGYNCFMSTPILTTKLYIPPSRPNIVLRPRLIARLNEGLNRKLTLIAAPAGFGKTTLVSAWIASCDRQVAWLSLDEGDNDLTRFLLYLVAALRTIAPTIGDGVLGVLQSSQPPPPEAILTALLNDISAVPSNFVLVFDDYHRIDAQPVDQALAFLLEHTPPQMHLVLTTREEPQFPLARLRVRNQLTELRAADLRFTPAEAATFLREVMELDLSAEDIAALEDRTEGWIAGLQLAALSLQGHQNIPSFIQAFAGDNRYIVDYLVEEVLQRQPEQVRSFLLQTAILDRLHGSLCDAVTGQTEGKMQLESLDRGNFFVVPLDDTRQWYRYHHLFADVLFAQLSAEQPNHVAMLHRRASAWYEQHDSAADAIRHAMAAQDFARAADLVELAAPATSRRRQEATLLGWLKSLPDDLIRLRPVLSAVYGGVLLSSGALEGVETRLQDAERWLEPGEATHACLDARTDEMVVVDEAAFRHLPGSIAVWRAGQALALGDVRATVSYAQRALDLVRADDHLWRGAAASLLGLAAWTNGDLEVAYQRYIEGMAHLQMAGNIADAIGGTIALTDIRIAQGCLRQAMRIYERGLQLATEQGEPALRGTADMYVGMSQLHCERGELYAATEYLLRAKEQGEHTGFPQNPYRWRVAMARIREAQGDLDDALALLDEAERLYVPDFFPQVRPIAAMKTRVWLAQGRLGEALDWARVQGLSAQDDLSYGREFAHITLARLLLIQGKSNGTAHSIGETIEFLHRLLQAAEAGERTGSVIEILVLLSLAHHVQGNLPPARTSLSRALILAEPEGYVRMFVGEGPPIAILLRAIAKQPTAPSYVHQLLVALGKAEDTPVKQGVIEPLSVRELEVLKLLKTDLTGPEIARELMVSLHTLRTHTNHIYTKLGMNNRRAAVRRAEELDLC